MKRSIFNILRTIVLKSLSFEKNEIKKKLPKPTFTYFEALITNMMMKILVNLIFEVKTKKKCFSQVFSLYVNKYCSGKKIFPSKVVADEKIYLYCSTQFLPKTIIF